MKLEFDAEVGTIIWVLIPTIVLRIDAKCKGIGLIWLCFVLTVELHKSLKQSK